MSVPQMDTLPSSEMSIFTPVRSMISLMVFPLANHVADLHGIDGNLMILGA